MERRRRGQAGNIFFALFAATAMVGIVGAGLSSVIRGPATSVSNVTRQNMAENNMLMAARLAVVAAAAQPLDGDCDADGFVEPLPYRSGGANKPAGGGYLPTTIGATLTDPWNTDYGYCVWDHGDKRLPADNIVACGGSGALRLTGAPAADANGQHVIALISAGKDRLFQTSCINYVNPTTPLVSKTAGSDDIIFKYTYGEAIKAGDGLWSIKEDEPETATIGKDLEISGSLELIGGGLILPDQTGSGACGEANDQQMRRNTATTPTTLEICEWDGVTGTWGAMNGLDLWTPHVNGTDIYRSAGKVGVGTASPQVPLHAKGNANILALEGTDHAYLSFYPDGLGAGRKAYFGFPGSGSNDVSLDNEFGSGVEITLGANGNVGVGTGASATHKLDVAGSQRSTGHMYINNASPTVYLQDTDHRTAMLHANGSSFYVLTTGAANSTTATANGSYWPFAISMTNDDVDIGGNLSMREGNLSLGAYAMTSDAGTLRDAGGGWVRTYGATGWYNQTYGGGWHMSDATWIRSYGSKPVYMSNGLDTGGASGIGCSGGLGGGYMLRVCGTQRVDSNQEVAGNIYWGTGGNWLSAYLNQAVLTSSSPSFSIVYATSSVRAPIFYDSQNTGYYTDPNGGSVLNELTLNGNLTVHSTSQFNNSVIDMPNLNPGAGHYVCFGTTNGRLKAQNAACNVSDRRLKTNIKPLQPGLGEILKLNPVSFEWKNKKKQGEGTQFGLIAQDVKTVFPNLVTGKGTGIDDDWYGVDYIALTAPMINAIKELKVENEALSAENDALRSELQVINADLVQRIEALEARP